MADPQEKNRGISQVWRVFASMRVGLVLMFLLAGAASLGVLLPQGTATQQDILSKIKVLLGIDQVFATWWFKTLACLLGINVLACVFNRAGAVFHVFKHPRKRVNAYERLKFNDTFTLKAEIQEVSESVSQALLSSNYRVMQNTDEEQVLFYADKHRIAILGPIISHIGALVLIVGVIWGSFVAYEGEVSSVPGATFNLNKIATHGTGEQIDPNLKIQLNQAKSTGTMSDIKGNISFIEDGNVVLTGDIGYNAPLKYTDLRVHLVRFTNGMQVNVTYLGKTMPVILTANTNSHTQLPGNDGLMLIWQNVNPRLNSPTVDYALLQGTSLIQQGRLGIGTVANPVDQLTISVDGYRGIATLRVVRNPELPLVLSGIIMLVLGMFISLLLSYRKVWISLTPEGEQVLVNAGGFGRLKLDFGAEFSTLLDDVKGYHGG